MFETKVALVTGASRGIGRTTSSHLAHSGCSVALLARNRGEVEEVAREIAAETGSEVRGFALDVTEEDKIDGVLAEVEGQCGPIDILVNNAGLAVSASLAKTDANLFQRTMSLNVVAPYRLMTRLSVGMKERKFGRIINVGSTASLKGYRYTAAYCASKHALLEMTRAFSKDLISCGVTANVVCPGFVDTDLTRRSVETIVNATGRSTEEAIGELVAESPLQRLVQPEEVAAVINFLAGGAAGAISGQSIGISGGEVS